MDVILGIARATHLLAGLSLFGALLFRAWIAPAPLIVAGAAGKAAAERMQRLIRSSAIMTLVSACVFLPLKAARMVGEAGIGALIPVLYGTRFGHGAVIELALVAIALGFTWRAPRRGEKTYAYAAGLAGASLALQLVTGHGAALGGRAGVTA